MLFILEMHNMSQSEPAGGIKPGLLCSGLKQVQWTECDARCRHASLLACVFVGWTFLMWFYLEMEQNLPDRISRI